MKNNQRFMLFLAVAFILGGLVAFFLVEYIRTFSVYDDGYGTEISSDNDWLILTISALIMFIFTISTLLRLRKGMNINITASFAVCLVISAICAFYPLGTFTKAMIKGKEFSKNQGYLYIGIVGVILLTLSILAAVKAFKNYRKLQQQKTSN